MDSTRFATAHSGSLRRGDRTPRSGSLPPRDAHTLRRGVRDEGIGAPNRSGFEAPAATARYGRAAGRPCRGGAYRS